MGLGGSSVVSRSAEVDGALLIGFDVSCPNTASISAASFCAPFITSLKSPHPSSTSEACSPGAGTGISAGGVSAGVA